MKKIAIIVFIFLLTFSSVLIFSQKAHAQDVDPAVVSAIAAVLNCINDPSSCGGGGTSNQPEPTPQPPTVVPTAAPTSSESYRLVSGIPPTIAPQVVGPTFIPEQQYVADNHDGTFIVVINGETKGKFPTQKEAEDYYNAQFATNGWQNPGSGTPPLYVTGPSGYVNPSAYPGQKTKSICELGEQPSGNCDKTICPDGTLVDGGAKVCENGNSYCKEKIEGACKLNSTCTPNQPLQTTAVSECKTADGKKGTSGGHCYCQADGQSVVCTSETACTPNESQQAPQGTITPTPTTSRTIPTTVANPTCRLSVPGGGVTNFDCAGGTIAPSATSAPQQPTPRR